MTPVHSHPWAQAVLRHYAGWLSVETGVGNYIAPPQRAIWYTAAFATRSAAGRNRDAGLVSAAWRDAWDAQQCRVIEVSPLIRELICHFANQTASLTNRGAMAGWCRSCWISLPPAPEVSLSLPLPHDTRLRQLWPAAFSSNRRIRRLLRQVGVNSSAPRKKPLSRLCSARHRHDLPRPAQRLRLLEIPPLGTGRGQ